MAAKKSTSIIILLLGLLFTSWFNKNGEGRKVVEVSSSVEKGLDDAGAGKGTNLKSGETMRLDNYKGSMTIGKSSLRISNANGQVSWINGRHMRVENNHQNDGHLPEEVEDAGFASTADYSAPKHHPPKNN